jgi:hypothetical protein
MQSLHSGREDKGERFSQEALVEGTNTAHAHLRVTTRINDKGPGICPGLRYRTAIFYCESEWTDASVFSSGSAVCAWVVGSS